MNLSLRRRLERAFWDVHSRDYDAAAAAGPFESMLLDWLGSPSAGGADVLVDLGCGTGRLLPPLAAAGWRVVGADVSPGMLRRASARNAGAATPVATAARNAATPPGRVALVRLDLNGPLPFRDVGRAILVHSLQVVRDPGRVLRRVHGILAPGGRLLVVAKKAPGRPRRTRRGLVRGLKQLAAATGWTRSFPDDRLPALLADAGFVVHEDRGTDDVAAVLAAKGDA